jgi:hypothetical protein
VKVSELASADKNPLLVIQVKRSTTMKLALLTFALIAISTSAMAAVIDSITLYQNISFSKINDLGTIVGGDVNGGFVLQDGVFTRITYGGMVAFPTDINDAGQIVGLFLDPSTNREMGFLDDNGVFTTIDYPGSTNTYVKAISNTGTIVGQYTGPNNSFGSFFTSSTGVYSSIGALGAEDINNSGQIVGSIDVRGFLREPNGSLITIDADDAPGINDLGEVVGSNNLTLRAVFYDASLGSHVVLPPLGFTHLTLSGINNSREVVGQVSFQTGAGFAFVGHLTLTPNDTQLPEPGAFLLCAGGLLLVGLRYRARLTCSAEQHCERLTSTVAR